MRLLEFFPSLGLDSLIYKYVYLETDSVLFGFRSIPRNYPAIFFCDDEPGVWEMEIGLETYQIRDRNVYFAGLGFEPSVMTFRRKLKLWITMLKPHAARVIFGGDPVDFVNKVIRVTETHHSLRILGDKLWQCHPDLRICYEQLELYFKQFLGNRYFLPTVRRALSEISHTNGMTDLSAIARFAHIGNRNLLRHFNDQLGINPKKYMAMVRFSKVMSEILGNPAVELELLALHYGFYDLSHLNKEAMRFLGQSLSVIKTQEQSLNKNIL